MPKEWAGRPVYSVSEIVRILSSELEQAFPDLWVEGEVSGFRRAASGHCYFTLKDAGAALKVVLFRTHAMRLGFDVENGLLAVARGRLSVYAASGDLQLYATTVEPAGLGALQMAFEQAKRRLMEEGLTDPARKRPIPAFPERVGIVTSLEGAALRDVLSVMRRRGALFQVLVSPALVQGTAAPASLRAALQKLARTGGVDVVLLTRGGGSMEDLQAFNDESLARMVASFPIPVISAVGHEVDTVLTDLTADLRAPTPSVAAELLTTSGEAVAQSARESVRRLRHVMSSRLLSARERLDRCRSERMGLLVQRRLSTLQEGSDRASERAARAMSFKLGGLAHRSELCARALSAEGMRRWVESLATRLDQSADRLEAAFQTRLGAERARVAGLARVLDSLSPLKVLGRGYAAVFDEGARPVTDAAQVPAGSSLSLALGRGSLDCTVTGSPASRLPAVLRRDPNEAP